MLLTPLSASAVPGTSPDVKLSFHIFKKGQDGWYFRSSTVGFLASFDPIGSKYHPINGTDLTDIKNDSVIFPILLNTTHLVGNLISGSGASNPGCEVFNPFQNTGTNHNYNGFWILCNGGTGGYTTTIGDEPELEIAVLNP